MRRARPSLTCPLHVTGIVFRVLESAFLRRPFTLSPGKKTVRGVGMLTKLFHNLDYKAGCEPPGLPQHVGSARE